MERFSRIPFPVHKVSASTPAELFELLPGLKRYFNKIPDGIKDLRDMPEQRMRSPRDLVRIITYIIIFYDPETDLIHEYPDNYRERKDAAAKIAGFERLSNGEWPDPLEVDNKGDVIPSWGGVMDLIELRDQQVVDWIIDYLRFRNNLLWQEIIFLQEEIESLYRERSQAIRDNNVKADTLKKAKDRNTDLQMALKQFFALHGELKDKAVEQMFPVSPENVFSELKIPAELYQLRQVKDVKNVS